MPDLVSRAATAGIDPADRIAYWEDYNRRALVGLACTSYSDDGLLARQANYRLGDVRLADISGNAHAIERDPTITRATPKDSVFATLLLKGEAVFLHEHGCLAATAGDLVLYDTRRPYLFGFSSSMRQLLLDIPSDLFERACLPGGVPAPMLFGRTTAREGALVKALARATTHHDTPVLDLLRLLTTARSGDRTAPPAYRTQLLLAEDHIERHLQDPSLSPARVAEALGVSVRHLSRIFASAGTTPARHILARRLHHARADLTSPDLTIADIAHRWGFATQSHFTRLFRTHYNQTPTQARQSC